MTGERSAAETVSSHLGDQKLVVASNRQPYSHEREDGDIVVNRPAGGLTSALDPMMQSAGGTWVAWGSGDADFDVADADGRVSVPPESPAYEIRRVPLSDEQVEGYYYGYSNQVLWPICHIDPEKMNAEEGFWNHYQQANRAFADAIIDETDTDSVIWFQDYHLGLAPRHVREERPDTFCMQFWHITWPSWDVFQTCPQYEQLLDGLLANDLLGFHTERYCQNFLDCAAMLPDIRVDRATRSVVYDGRRTFVRPFPLGIDAVEREELAESTEATAFWNEFREEYAVGDTLAIGVERLDYTKGIPERLSALERFWERHPEWRGEFTYVQKASESRSQIGAYRELQGHVESEIERIDDRFGTDDWSPIVYLNEHLPKEGLAALYREADLGIVTPRRDGMNLVAKEFIASQVGEPGVLLLSELAGANGELGDEAVSVHPHDTKGFADAIEEALSLPQADRERRMYGLKKQVRSNDVYAWMNAQFRTIEAIRRGREIAAESPRGR
ncbi:trehalose-6-phosphate synthase [Haladaptatus sp. R4]|uniref:alpha,alpha-trehalose-phosphate synthase (UDP-forming) n=1 Tax=Haladaptatus sp. R4 TaxID=1679489 RepID=UPI0007B4BC70|nr:trehalose-6-phosphate synthase [Haladaptatus sp. R4]KZN24683.1 trehalose-6-phosphate synthase [Haladaptatus sp. R4]